MIATFHFLPSTGQVWVDNFLLTLVDSSTSVHTPHNWILSTIIMLSGKIMVICCGYENMGSCTCT